MMYIVTQYIIYLPWIFNYVKHIYPIKLCTVYHFYIIIIELLLLGTSDDNINKPIRVRNK